MTTAGLSIEHDEAVVDQLPLAGVLDLLKSDPHAWHRLKGFRTRAIALDRAERLVSYFDSGVHARVSGAVLYAGLAKAAAA